MEEEEGKGEGSMSNRALVTKTTKRLRCEVHGCKQKTEYGLGLSGFKAAYFNVCPECLEDIVRQGGKFLFDEEWTPEDGMHVNTIEGKAEIVAVEPANEDKKDEIDFTLTSSVNTRIYGERAKLEENDDPLSDEPTDEVKKEDEAITPQAQEETSNEPTTNQEVKEEVKEPAKEVYTCIDCGATFKKPEEKMKYVAHRKTCPVKKANKEKNKDVAKND